MQDARHLHAQILCENSVGLGVLILRHPSTEFVLEDAAAIDRGQAAVATCRTAGARPVVLAGNASGGSSPGRILRAGFSRQPICQRSEERRVGKECRSRWLSYV